MLHMAVGVQGGEATGSFGMPPQPLVRRTDLAAFETRPPKTDFEPAKQVRPRPTVFLCCAGRVCL